MDVLLFKEAGVFEQADIPGTSARWAPVAAGGEEKHCAT